MNSCHFCARFHFINTNQVEETEEEIKGERYKNSNLEEAQKEQYLHQLQAYMVKEKPYQKSDLTLPELAQKMDIPNSYLSQIINEKIKTNFHDFINQYRIEEAKRLFHDPQFEHYTVIAISMEAGFNSKSTFYTAFKKFTGTTPSKFRKLEEV